MSNAANHHTIDSLDDSRVKGYQNLRDRALRGESLFIAEGQLLTERLLASRFPVESLFVIDRHLPRIEKLVPPEVPVYLADESLVSQIVGYPFHQGMLAAGGRLETPPLKDLLQKPTDTSSRNRRGWVILPEVTDAENLGLIFRTAAAMGIEGVLLGPRCCDPLARRAMRLSMGAVLQLPYARSHDLTADLAMMEDRFGFELLAAVLDKDATTLDKVTWPERSAILFGNEYHGLPASMLGENVRRITIPMAADVDSLNLSVSVGVFLYDWRQTHR